MYTAVIRLIHTYNANLRPVNTSIKVRKRMGTGRGKGSIFLLPFAAGTLEYMNFVLKVLYDDRNFVYALNDMAVVIYCGPE
jgi:hypothetical protein